jgi:hypothetical protein
MGLGPLDFDRRKTQCDRAHAKVGYCIQQLLGWPSGMLRAVARETTTCPKFSQRVVRNNIPILLIDADPMRESHPQVPAAILGINRCP